MAEVNVIGTPKAGIALRAALWVAQLLVAVPFVAFGFMKATAPVEQLATMMAWAGQLPEFVVRVTGVIDMAGGLGLVLPALTRVKPVLVRYAAMGCIALQSCAIVFHVSRGEANLIWLNFVFLALSIFVLWGRTTKAPIAAR